MVVIFIADADKSSAHTDGGWLWVVRGLISVGLVVNRISRRSEFRAVTVFAVVD